MGETKRSGTLRHSRLGVSFGFLDFFTICFLVCSIERTKTWKRDLDFALEVNHQQDMQLSLNGFTISEKTKELRHHTSASGVDIVLSFPYNMAAVIA